MSSVRPVFMNVRWERMVLLLSWEGDCSLRTVACLIVCLCVCWKLPVPVAVTALMYNQRLLPCISHSPRLLDRNSQSQTSNTVDGSHGKACAIVCVCVFDCVHTDLLKRQIIRSPSLIRNWESVCLLQPRQTARQPGYILHSSRTGWGHPLHHWWNHSEIPFKSSHVHQLLNQCRCHLQFYVCVHSVRPGLTSCSAYDPTGLLRRLCLHLRCVPSSADGQ